MTREASVPRTAPGTRQLALPRIQGQTEPEAWNVNGEGPGDGGHPPPSRGALTLSGPGGTFLTNGGVAKLVIALACQAGGRGFKSRRSRSFYLFPSVRGTLLSLVNHVRAPRRDGL